LSTTAKLVNDGKKVLGQDRVFWNLYGLYDGFFKILEHGNYSREIDLLHILERWAINGSSYSTSWGTSNVSAAVFSTHQQYVRGFSKRREFGDVTFATLFSRPNAKRIGFVNAFQIKVDFSASNAYCNLFVSPNQKQLDFYRTNFIEALDPIYNDLICDFLHYFLIGGPNANHVIMEIPLSATWLDDSSGAYWGILPALLRGRYISDGQCAGLDTMIRKVFLTTGINIERILTKCTQNLRDTLQRILDHGVLNSKKEEKPFSKDIPPNIYNEREEFEPPDRPIASSIVIATEVALSE